MPNFDHRAPDRHGHGIQVDVVDSEPQQLFPPQPAHECRCHHGIGFGMVGSRSVEQRHHLFGGECLNARLSGLWRLGIGGRIVEDLLAEPCSL
jgi:hypothetical protein